MTRSLPGFLDERQTFWSLVDEFIESWVCWREACEAVHSACECWQQWKPTQRGLAFARYRAALDRAEQAHTSIRSVPIRVREARGGCHV